MVGGCEGLVVARLVLVRSRVLAGPEDRPEWASTEDLPRDPERFGDRRGIPSRVIHQRNTTVAPAGLEITRKSGKLLEALLDLRRGDVQVVAGRHRRQGPQHIAPAGHLEPHLDGEPSPVKGPEPVAAAV